MILSCYFESWDEYLTPMSAIEGEYTHVNIAFANPNGTFDGASFRNTGLSFSSSFDGVKAQIYHLTSRGVKVFLSVGGATFPFPDNFNGGHMVNLALALGCSGIDIDWEPVDGIKSDGKWGEIIRNLYALINGRMQLSAAVWATGAMEPNQNSMYQGVNKRGLLEEGVKLNFLNLMTYDGGKELDIIACFNAYRNLYKGPLVFGFEFGKMGWGKERD